MVGIAVAVGAGVGIGTGVAVGVGVTVGASVAVGTGIGGTVGAARRAIIVGAAGAEVGGDGSPWADECYEAPSQHGECRRATERCCPAGRAYRPPPTRRGRGNRCVLPRRQCRNRLQIADEGSHACVARRRVGLCSAIHRRSQPVRHGRGRQQVRQGDGRRRHGLRLRRQERLPRVLSEQHLREHQAQGEDVGPTVNRCALALLRGHVATGPRRWCCPSLR